MKKKLLIALLAIVACFCLAFGLTACSSSNESVDEQPNTELGETEQGGSEQGGTEQEGTTTAEPTEGLEYTLSDDGTYYIVSGIGTATDTDIVIASDRYCNCL